MALTVVAAATLIWLAHSRFSGWTFDWRIFRTTLTSLEWSWLLAACGAVLAGYFGRALRWRVLMQPVKPDPSLWNLCSATYIGFAAITLLGRPGELVRPYLIATKENVPMSSQLAAWLLERIYDLLMVLAIFGFALARVRRSDAALGPALAWVFSTGGWFVAGISIVTLGLLVAFRHFSGPMQRRLLDALSILPERHFSKAERLVTAFVQGVESTRSDRALLLLIGYTVLEWAIIAITTFCVIRAFGHAMHLGWLDVLIFLGFLAFGAVVQIPGVGGGVQVVTVLVLTRLFGVSLEISTTVALVLWTISFVVVVPIGVLLAIREGVRWSTIRRLEGEAGT
ncbi:MAG: lysylphosphatidylglycerol synthase transmembrane domain-containing protein [Bryobacteraceae bacterium]